MNLKKNLARLQKELIWHFTQYGAVLNEGRYIEYNFALCVGGGEVQNSLAASPSPYE